MDENGGFMVSRRAFLFLAVGASLWAPVPATANSIEPILRSPSALIADLSAIMSADPEVERLHRVLWDVLSERVFEILQDEAERAQLTIPVLKHAPNLAETPDPHAELYVRVRLDIRTIPAESGRFVLGAVGMKFQRIGYEPVQSALPMSLFLAEEGGVETKAEAAIREQLAGLIEMLQRAAP
jgi:hypothetical protein